MRTIAAPTRPANAALQPTLSENGEPERFINVSIERLPGGPENLRLRAHRTLMKIRLANPSLSPSSLTPALGETFLRRDRRNAVDRLIGDQRDAGVEEIEAWTRLRLLAGFGVFDRRFDSHGRHQKRVLLRGGADDAGGDVLHAWASAVDGDDERVLGLVGGPQRAIGARRGWLVDGIDDVDVRILLEQRLHCGAAQGFLAPAPLMADDALVGLVSVLLPVRVLDAKAL